MKRHRARSRWLWMSDADACCAPRLENENHTKDIDFTPSGTRVRREAGYEATMRALRQAPWQGSFDAIEGLILHESMPDLAMAAE
jgi:NTE family protein